MIIRVAQRARFVIIEQATVDDARLSWAALGLLTYLLGRPDGWEIRSEDLGRERDAPRQGRDHVRGLLRELQAVGYLHREKVRNPETGRWVTRQVLYERPQEPTENDGRSQLSDMPESDGKGPGHAQDGTSGAGTSGVGEPGVGTPGALTNTEEPIKESGTEVPADAVITDAATRKRVAQEMATHYYDWVKGRTGARPPEEHPAIAAVIRAALAEFTRLQVTHGLKGLHLATPPRPITKQTLWAEIQGRNPHRRADGRPAPVAAPVNDWVDREQALIAANDRAGQDAPST